MLIEVHLVSTWDVIKCTDFNIFAYNLSSLYHCNHKMEWNTAQKYLKNLDILNKISNLQHNYMNQVSKWNQVINDTQH